MNFEEIIYEIKNKAFRYLKLDEYFGIKQPMLPASRIKVVFERVSDTEALVKRYDKKTNEPVYTPFIITTLSEKGAKRLEQLLKEKRKRFW